MQEINPVLSELLRRSSYCVDHQLGMLDSLISPMWFLLFGMGGNERQLYYIISE